MVPPFAKGAGCALCQRMVRPFPRWPAGGLRHTGGGRAGAAALPSARGRTPDQLHPSGVPAGKRWYAEHLRSEPLHRRNRCTSMSWAPTAGARFDSGRRPPTTATIPMATARTKTTVHTDAVRRRGADSFTYNPTRPRISAAPNWPDAGPVQPAAGTAPTCSFFSSIPLRRDVEVAGSCGRTLRQVSRPTTDFFGLCVVDKTGALHQHLRRQLPH